MDRYESNDNEDVEDDDDDEVEDVEEGLVPKIWSSLQPVRAAKEPNPPRRPCVVRETGEAPLHRTTEGKIGRPLEFVTDKNDGKEVIFSGRSSNLSLNKARLKKRI